MRKQVRSFSEKYFSRLIACYRILRYGVPIYNFRGWGMWTQSISPWEDHNQTSNAISRDFLLTQNKIKDLFASNNFIATQFHDSPDHLKVLDELSWRHFIVFWSAIYAAKNTDSTCKNFVECGVCDGLTIAYALEAVNLNCKDQHAFLLDSWESFETEQLVDGEQLQDDYSYLSIENTKKNLSHFQDSTTFVKGLIPESLTQIEFPSTISWLHIDLNAAAPTKASLEFFYNRMEIGGVFLFDDYAGRGFEETRTVVDKFFEDKQDIIFFHMPTSNAIAFKIKKKGQIAISVFKKYVIQIIS